MKCLLHHLRHLSTWSPLGDAIWGGLTDAALLEKVDYWGAGLETKKKKKDSTTTAKAVSSPLPAPALCTTLSTPLWTLALESCESNVK